MAATASNPHFLGMMSAGSQRGSWDLEFFSLTVNYDFSLHSRVLGLVCCGSISTDGRIRNAAGPVNGIVCVCTCAYLYSDLPIRSLPLCPSKGDYFLTTKKNGQQREVSQKPRNVTCESYKCVYIFPCLLTCCHSVDSCLFPYIVILF